MIRRVRRQFICITMAMLTAVLLVPLIALNVVTEAMSYNQTRNLLEQIAISETTVPELPDDMPPDGKQPRQSTDTATETGTSAAETTAETTTETTATETAAAETTAKAAPAEQPKNPVQTQAPAVQSPVQTTAAPRTTAAPQTRATTTARHHQPTGDKACGDHCAAADKTTPADDAAGSRSAALVGIGRTGSPLGKRRELCCRKAGDVLCRTAGAADPVYAHAPGRPRRTRRFRIKRAA